MPLPAPRSIAATILARLLRRRLPAGKNGVLSASAGNAVGWVPALPADDGGFRCGPQQLDSALHLGVVDPTAGEFYQRVVLLYSIVATARASADVHPAAGRQTCPLIAKTEVSHRQQDVDNATFFHASHPQAQRSRWPSACTPCLWASLTAP